VDAFFGRALWTACALLLGAVPVLARPAGASPGVLAVRRPDRVSHDRFDPSLPVPAVARGTVDAGSTIVVTWKRDIRIEECEILLSLDGGRSFPIRVSPELAAGADRYVWRVPDLSASGVLLCLRARIAGREVNGPAGDPLTLIAPVSSPFTRWHFHEGGFWILPDPAGDPSASSLGPGDAEFRQRHPSPISRAPGRSGLAAPAPRSSTTGDRAIVETHAPATHRTLATRRSQPLRE
jgi:hypothetical protein